MGETANMRRSVAALEDIPQLQYAIELTSNKKKRGVKYLHIKAYER
jgi:hypothetical protein